MRDDRKKTGFAGRSGWLLIAAFGLLCNLAGSAQAQSDAAPGVFVKTALGGFILGYDIDQNGTEGYLAEALSLSDGKFNVAVETFDQATGKILKIVSQQTETKNDFVALGVFGNGIGLVELEKTKNLFVSQRLYRTINPLSSNKLGAAWTPPLTVDEPIVGIAGNQGSNLTAVLDSKNFQAFVFSTDVAANTFGPTIQLADSVFASNDSPVFAVNSQTGEAVVAASTGGILTLPKLATVNLTTSQVSEFTGLGFGFVNGLAVDSATNTACTTSEVDFGVEFYDLATQSGFEVSMHNATNQLQAGQAVAFDPVHKLFLIGQEFSSTASSGSSIQVFDEQGNFIEAINGLSLPASPTTIAINPNTRTGFVVVTPLLNQLQQFTY
jgi:hypothetical protein